MKNETKKIIIIILLSIIICLLLFIIFEDNKKKIRKINNNNLINVENDNQDSDNKINQTEENDQITDELDFITNETEDIQENDIVEENTQNDNNTNNNNIESNNSITNTNSDNQTQNNNNNSNTNNTDNTNKNTSNNNTDNTINNQPIIQTPTTVQEYRQDMAKDVLALVNQARSENGLQPLVWNDSLEASAMIRSKELVTLFDHTRPDGSSCFTAVNVDFYFAIGENIAAGQNSAQSVFNSWMNSPGHRANILSENFTDIGISLYYDSASPYKYNWTQLFIGK